MGKHQPYDPTDPRSIEAYARRLEGHSLREMLAEDARTVYQTGKGKLGDVVERSYFGINPGNISAPDFEQAGVELKTTPLKRVGKKLKAKERLSLQMIDYMNVHREEWESSSFLRKNALILLLFYLHEPNREMLDYVFKIARLWEIPEADLEIIRDDWEKIVGKIRAGKAHELSEGDTMYLAACTKGAKGTDRRKQPFSDEPAKPRAFSLKASYMNSVIDASLKQQQAVSAAELKTGKTFEQIVHERFRPYVGMTADEIAQALGIEQKPGKPKSKAFHANVTKRILGVADENRIAEFEKADINVKTIRLRPGGMPKEAVSFPAFKYLDLVEQGWDESDLKEALSRRFFFVIYELDAQGTARLARTQFWRMPVEDIERHARECFERTVELIMEDKADYLPQSTDNPVCHVRPHGRDSADTLPTPSGRMVVRKSFWLNQKYLAEQLRAPEDS
ncbi:MAG: Sau3AI family type II restriction endonuclease [Coriobacteriia bacterium]